MKPSAGQSRGLLCAALLWSALPLESAAVDPSFTAEDLVQRTMSAGRSLDYDGVFVYQRETALDTMRLIHKGSGPTEMERLVSLSGPAREVTRDGSKVTCTFADDKAVMVEKRQPRDLFSFGMSRSVESLMAEYEFQMDPPDRIAGRTTQVVHILPKTMYRYGYRLWIDEATTLLLKSVVLDHDGRPLEQVQFAQIDIGKPIPDELLQPEIAGVDFTWYTNDDRAPDAGEKTTPGDWDVAWLPPGFKMHNEQTQHMLATKMPVRHFVYSDGLATVSVFIEELQGSTAPIQGYSSMGAVNAFSRVARNFQITVVGEVPQATVRQIAVAVANRKTE